MAKVKAESELSERFKIKIIKADSHDESHFDLEDTVNEWLGFNPDLEIFDIQLQTPNRGVFVMIHYSGTALTEEEMEEKREESKKTVKKK